MSTKDSERKLNRTRAILSMNSAMLGEIAPTLRAAQISWDDETVHLFFYYDGEISDEDNESAECIATELIAGYPDYKLEESILRWDYPKKIPEQGVLVYLRQEPAIT